MFKDTLPIRLKPGAIWEVWAYRLIIEQTFPFLKFTDNQKSETTGKSKKWQNVNFP